MFATDLDVTADFASARHPLVARFHAFIRNPAFCCVGAKSAQGRGRLHVTVARNMRSSWDDLDIYPQLLAFTRRYQRNPTLFQSFAVIFQDPGDLDEAEFEQVLWKRLQSLSDKDEWYGNSPDRRTSDEPTDPNFALSFGGEACFVVGLHPQASRPSRRFERPAMVFNLHDQFTRLREAGLYEKLRANILERDLAQSGSINPMLARHGSVSEARQYSGRLVDSEWSCPFRRSRSSVAMPLEIPPRSGVAFTLNRGQRLKVIDPEGEQVADLLAFNRHDAGEVISSGRSLDYASRLFLTTGDALYSNRSRVMLRINEDRVGRHDFLLTPCSADTFRIIYNDTALHRGCFGNLAAALAPHGITPDQIPIAFNVFMNVDVNGQTGALTVLPPRSRAGDYTIFEAEQDLIIGLTACSALQSNNYAFKPIHYEIG